VLGAYAEFLVAGGKPGAR